MILSDHIRKKFPATSDHPPQHQFLSAAIVTYSCMQAFLFFFAFCSLCLRRQAVVANMLRRTSRCLSCANIGTFLFASHKYWMDLDEIRACNQYHQKINWLHFGWNWNTDKGVGYNTKFESMSEQCGHVAIDSTNFAVHTNADATVDIISN